MRFLLECALAILFYMVGRASAQRRIKSILEQWTRNRMIETSHGVQDATSLLMTLQQRIRDL